MWPIFIWGEFLPFFANVSTIPYVFDMCFYPVSVISSQFLHSPKLARCLLIRPTIFGKLKISCRRNARRTIFNNKTKRSATFNWCLVACWQFSGVASSREHTVFHIFGRGRIIFEWLLLPASTLINWNDMPFSDHILRALEFPTFLILFSTFSLSVFDALLLFDCMISMCRWIWINQWAMDNLCQGIFGSMEIDNYILNNEKMKTLLLSSFKKKKVKLCRAHGTYTIIHTRKRLVWSCHCRK